MLKINTYIGNIKSYFLKNSSKPRKFAKLFCRQKFIKCSIS